MGAINNAHHLLIITNYRNSYFLRTIQVNKLIWIINKLHNPYPEPRPELACPPQAGFRIWFLLKIDSESPKSGTGKFGTRNVLEFK